MIIETMKNFSGKRVDILKDGNMIKSSESKYDFQEH